MRWTSTMPTMPPPCTPLFVGIQRTIQTSSISATRTLSQLLTTSPSCVATTSWLSVRFLANDSPFRNLRIASIYDWLSVYLHVPWICQSFMSENYNNRWVVTFIAHIDEHILRVWAVFCVQERTHQTTRMMWFGSTILTIAAWRGCRPHPTVCILWLL